MKLLSGTASRFPLTAFVLAALAIGLPSAALAQSGRAPSLETEAGLGCLLGMAPDGCQTGFANARAAWNRTTYCTVEYTHRRLDNCSDGPLESIEYLGADAAGADVYEVNYMNANMTYVIFPRAPDGRIPRFRIFDATPNSIIGSVNRALVAITSPADDTQPVYTRPEEGA
jgi:hypothetical protein